MLIKFIESIKESKNTVIIFIHRYLLNLVLLNRVKEFNAIYRDITIWFNGLLIEETKHDKITQKRHPSYSLTLEALTF